MKKNIWIINHYAGETLFDKGGRHYWLAKYLKRSGYEPTVFCSNTMHGKAERYFDTDDLWQEHEAEEIGVPFVFIKARTYMGNGKQRILNMMDFYRNVQKSAKEYAKTHGKPDVIYASSVHPLTIVAGIHLAKYFGVKCVAEIRDLWPESLVAYGIAGPRHPAVLCLRRLEKWIYRKADAVVFTMEGAYDYIAEQGWEKDMPRSKVHFINNGVDLEQFGYNREHFAVDDADLDDTEHFKIIYTGSIRQANHVEVLLETAKLIQNPAVKFLIWGSGDKLPHLQDRAEREQIGNVVFKGRVEKKYVPSIVSRADLNYIDETAPEVAKYGFSLNKMFDYFAAGQPILMGEAGRYNPVANFHAGLVCDGTPAGLARSIETAIGITAEEQQKIRDGLAKAAEHYSFARLTDDLIRVIEGK